MKARPILFSAPMVRALLDGRKTQTRRVMKPQPIGTPLPQLGEPGPCPYGEPGSLLWVRERASSYWNTWHYFADGPEKWGRDVSEKTFSRPSIHMPRCASRITLEITDVRVQRLQDISDEDAIAEGIEGVTTELQLITRSPLQMGHAERVAFAGLWDHVNGAGAWAANPYVWALTFKVRCENVDAVLKAAA
jgi:hypothetical protein